MKKALMQICTAMMVLALISGCQQKTTGTSPIQETGILTLSVNPEIAIEYNKEGKVTQVTGKNEDGLKIVQEMKDYIGKNCSDVVDELVVSIHKAGYFVDDIDGNSKNIVIQIESGSIIPNENFINEVTTKAQNTVKNLTLDSAVVAIDDDDYDQRYQQQGKPSFYITKEKAQEIALAQAKVNASEAYFDDREFDFENGVAIYELEFTANGIEYDYDIDAMTGKVLRAEHDSKEDRNDHDDNQRHPQQSNASYITKEKAQEIALAQAKVNASAAYFDDREFDFEKGAAIYELEFTANGIEYEYDIDAVTGKVLRAEHDAKDDRNDRYDDDDHDDDWDDRDDDDDDWDD